jgi:hypothetical protein
VTREIKARIYYQHEDTGRITERFIYLGEQTPDLGRRWFVIDMNLWTGRHDKNGTEIYENDQLKHPEFDEPILVEWNNEEAGFESCGAVSEWGSCEII